MRTEDPVLPYRDAVALAEAIPGAKHLTMEGAGHEMPRPILPEVIAAIVVHLYGASAIGATWN